MNAITTYYDYSELSLAAYSDLYSGMALTDYINALKNDGDGMSQSQAEEFAENWTVLDQYDGTTEESYLTTIGDRPQLFINNRGQTPIIH